MSAAFKRRTAMNRKVTATVGLTALVLAGLAANATTASAHPRPRGTAEAPSALKVAGQSSDALVDTAHPTLSWAPNDSSRGQAQTAYEVRVSDVLSDREDSRPQVWDSGQVRSSASSGVAYAGPALQANHTYEWTVRTWNRQGQQSAWSHAQRFDAGPMSVQDWSASWLQAKDGALLRRSFDLPKTVARARLYLGAQGLVEPHLNGAIIDPKQVLNSNVTDYAKRVVYRAYDVTDQLRRGQNALAVMVGQGQFAGSPTFIAQLEITFSDGTHTTISTDDQWRSAAGPVTHDDFYYGESWDARKEIAGWDAASLDDSSWAPVPVYAQASQPTSLAIGKPVTAADQIESSGWSRAALVDGIDMSTDQSEGYHSAIETGADHTKWVQVDLGSSQAVKRITLFPAHPTNDPAGDFPGAGFPVQYTVQVSNDPTFTASTTLVDRTATDQPNPGTTPVSFTTDGSGRYVRVTANKLACRGTSCTFRLAELGVYGADPAVTFGLTHLEADTTPPTRIVKTLAPTVTTTAKDGTTVYDFGQNYVGQVTLRANAPAGTTAVINKGELLDQNGRVSTANISFSSSDPTRQQDTYTFDGSGTQIWTPNFNYAGFRYAEVTGLPAGTQLSVVADVIHSDVASAGSFNTSNALLNQIQGALLQTQLNDLQGMPLDCPTREKRGWLGDAGDSDAEAMANLDMQSLYSKWLGDIRTSINSDGSVPSVSPDQGEGSRFYTDPAWGTAYPQVVWDSYTQYGDTSVVQDNYADVKGWVDYLGTISDSQHIVTNSPGSWGDDWLSTVSTPHVYFQTLFYLIDSRLLANMAQVLGQSADATRYTQLADAIAAGFTAKYFNADTDTYSPNTQLAYAMPLALGIVPAGHEQAVLGKLVKDIAAHDNHVTTGFVGTTYVYQALAKYHRNDIALAVAERTDYPSFGYMVGNGPGTIWEKWNNSSSPDGTSSKDHIGLAGSIGQWYYQQLAGIQPGTAGWRTFTLAPSVVGDLTHVSGSQQTVRGTIVSSWQRSGSTLTYHAVVPVGSTATIDLPLLGGTGSTVREGGRTVWAEGHPAADDAGLSVGQSTGDSLRLTAGSGDYQFTVTAPHKPVTALRITSTGNPDPITPGRSGDVNVLVEGHSTGSGSARLSAEVPAGWTASASPSTVPLSATDTATLATVHIAVPTGVSGGTYPVSVTVTAPNGTIAHDTVEVVVFGSWPVGTTAAASSVHAPNVVNGATRTYVAANAIDQNLATFWNDDTQGVSPDILTVTAPTAVALHGVGFASNPDGVPTDFTVQTWDGAQWATQAVITGNTASSRWIPFSSSVTTSQLRVVITATQDGSFSRVAELTP
ncbi:MAG: alpha-rhamnosidase [Frankiales bacterium]|nr:alpha-rhamnosidase [Frankiales bacterium]